MPKGLYTIIDNILYKEVIRMKMKEVQITIQELGEQGVEVTLEEIVELMQKNNTSLEQTIGELHSALEV